MTDVTKLMKSRRSQRPRADWNTAMNRRIKGALLVGGLAVATAVVLTGVLTAVLAKAMAPQHYCETGFSKLIDCTFHWSSRTLGQSTPIFTTPSNATSTIASGSRDTFRPTSVDVTSWAVANCPRNYTARRLLCAAASDAAAGQAADDDAVTGLPRPKPWLLTTAKSSPVIKAFHIETPLELAGVLSFYRLALSKRGWSENGGAVVEPDRALITFTTSDGPALLRLTRQDDRTIADLSLRKPTSGHSDILPLPGQVRLLLGNSMDEEAVITINAQTIKLAAHAKLAPDGREIKLQPGKYKVTLKVASGAAQSREFEVAADETW